MIIIINGILHKINTCLYHIKITKYAIITHLEFFVVDAIDYYIFSISSITFFIFFPLLTIVI